MNRMDRRSFLKIIGAGTAAGALNPLQLASCSSADNAGGTRFRQLDPLGFDVAVVGAGAAGIPAAIAAARGGTRVVLIEEDTVPGGAPVDMYVTFVCGDPRVGIFNDMMQELNRRYPLKGAPVPGFGKYGWTGNYHFWLPSAFQTIVCEMLAREKNITLMCGATVVDTLTRDAGNRTKVEGVRILRGYNTLQDIRAKITVDATGTGLVAAQAGCEFMYGREARSDYGESVGIEKGDSQPQHCTLMYITQRLRRDARLPFDKIPRWDALEADFRWIDAKDDPEAMDRRDAGIFLRWGQSVVCPDTLDSVAIAEAHSEILQKIRPELDALHDAGFGVHLAPKLGVRECRRIKGETVITYDHIARGTMPDDKIADARYSIDSWGLKDLPVHLKQVPPYGIPYRAVVPLATEGLLLAGRIISGTHIAASSYRVQPICAAIGEAVGTAAAMLAGKGIPVRDIDLRLLQAALDSKGLFDVYKNSDNH